MNKELNFSKSAVFWFQKTHISAPFSRIKTIVKGKTYLIYSKKNFRKYHRSSQCTFEHSCKSSCVSSSLHLCIPICLIVEKCLKLVTYLGPTKQVFWFLVFYNKCLLFRPPTQPPPKRTESEITFTEKSLCNKVVLQFVTLKFKHVLAICSPLKSNFMSVIDIMSGDLNFFFSF